MLVTFSLLKHQKVVLINFVDVFLIPPPTSGNLLMEGRPKPLEAALSAFIGSLDLKSWQIYSEGNGACVKIRFKPREGENVNTVELKAKGKWKKASPSQIKRDGARATKHAMALRSKSGSEPEKPRYAVSEEDFLDTSVIIPKSDLSEMSNCSSDINMSPLSVGDLQIRSLPTEPYISEQDKRDCSSIMSPLPEIQEDCESDTDSNWSLTTDERYEENPCLAKMCQYFDYNGIDQNVGVFKCSRDECRHTYICETCVQNGGHRGHKQYLVPYMDGHG